MVDVPKTTANKKAIDTIEAQPREPEPELSVSEQLSAPKQASDFVYPEGVTPIVTSPDERMAHEAGVAPTEAEFEFPPGVSPLPKASTDEELAEEEETPTSLAQELGEMFIGRLLGTDIGREDPLMWTRLGTQIGTSLAGAAGGASVGARTGAALFPPHPLSKVVGAGGGTLIGGALGSLTGAVTPEAALEVAEDLGIVDEGTRERLGLSDDELLTVVQGEALLEIAFPGAFALARLTKRAGVSFFTGMTRAQRRQVTRIGLEEGIWLTPIQVGNRQIAKGYVFIFGRLPAFGGRKIAKAVRANEQQYREALESLPQRLAPLATWDKVSSAIARDAKSVVKTFKDQISTEYEKVWKLADDLGVTVRPDNIFATADSIMARLEKKRQTKIVEKVVQLPGGPAVQQTTKKGKFPADVKPVVDFIREEILPMKGKITGDVAGQTFRQMDALAEKAQNMLAKLDPADQREARKWMTDIMQAIQTDALQNAIGPEARAVREEILRLDAKFSKFWQEIGETATAKKFTAVEKKGLKGADFDSATRLPVDQLANMVRAIDSPDVARELKNLVTPETYNQVVGTYLQDAFERGFVTIGDEVNKFSPDEFAKALGLDKSTSSRRQAVAEMLKLSDSNITLETLDELVEMGKTLQDVDVPNISVFLARSATLGGLRSLINRLVPGAVGAGAAVQSGFLGVGFMTAMVGIVGNRAVMKALADPANAQLTRHVFDRDAANIVRKQAMVKFLKTVIQDMSQDDLRQTGVGGTRTRTDLTGTRFLTERRVEQWKNRADKAVDLLFDHLSDEAIMQGLVSEDEADALEADKANPDLED